MMQAFSSTDVITVAGQRNSGKTTWIRKFLQHIAFPYIIFDPNDEYGACDGFPDFKYRYVPEDDSLEEFERFMRIVWNKGNVFVVIDEAEQFMNDPWTRFNGVSHAAKITRRGRHKNIGLLACTRAIAELNKNVIRQSNYMVLYYHQEPNELKYLSKFIGTETTNKLPKLGAFEFLVYSKGQSEVFNPIQI